MADTATASVDDIYLTRSEIYVVYHEIIDSQDKYLRSLPYVDNRYLQIDRASYDYDNVKANEPFKIKLTQDGVCPFIFFYVQTASDAKSLTNAFDNYLPTTAYELLGKGN